MIKLGMDKRLDIFDKSDTHHLDFGCGSVPRNPLGAFKLTCVDINSDATNHDLVVIAPGSGLPFLDNSFTSVSAYDVLEHLPRVSDKGNLYIHYMNELCRVLKPGGIAILIFPAYPHRDSFSDPTHVNHITKDSVDFFLATPGGPFYENIHTTFNIVKNRRLRRFGRWVYAAEVRTVKANHKNLRRRLSLSKRGVTRFLFPGHRIWVLQKRVDS